MKTLVFRLFASLIVLALLAQVSPAHAVPSQAQVPSAPALANPSKTLLSAFGLSSIPGLPTAKTHAQVQTFSCGDIEDVPESECDALVALYNSTNGVGWTNKSFWLTGTAVDDWYGVTVSGGFVTVLDLPANQLSGRLPVELGDLSNLTTLLLDGNQLTGKIPAELGNLTNLEDLDLNSNKLSGSIPLNFVNLASLDFFDFIDTYLCEPETFDFMTWKANVSDWNGTGTICFDCSEVDDEGEIPLVECEALVALYDSTFGAEWSNNSDWLSFEPGIFEVDDWFGVTVQNDHVVELWLVENNLSGNLPPELSNLDYLEFLDIHGNVVGGEIPSELGSMENLEYLDLGLNQLSGQVPSQLGYLSYLSTLYLDSNPLLRGSLPMSFVSLSLLDYFDFFDTSLCEPTAAEFQTWKATVTTYYPSGHTCHAPVAFADAYDAVEGTVLAVAAPGVLSNDTDEGGESLTAALEFDVIHGKLALAADGSFTYTSVSGFIGVDSFTYIATDGILFSDEVTVTITIKEALPDSFDIYLPMIVK